jgi:phospholipid-binding lipoprotein MlaA
MNKPSIWRRATVMLAASAWLAGCATVDNPDPLEPINRPIFKFNDTVDKVAVRPAAEVYRKTIPAPLRGGVTNFMDNVSDAWSTVNLVLQGRGKAAINDGMRVMVNTVFGMAGFLDPASEMGLLSHREDFGQTLGVWGVPAGAYLVLPVLGPSTLRDAAALTLNMKASPSALSQHVATRNSITALRLMNARANLLDASRLFQDAALDPYLFTRDAYLQRQASLLEVQDDEEIGKPPVNGNETPEASGSTPPAGDVSTGTRP